MKSGLTLIELITVIAIIGIMSAVTVPILQNYSPSIKLNGSARALSGHLREAQEKAITEQKQHLIRFHPETSPPSYELIRINNSIEELQNTFSLDQNITLALEASITNSEIIFSPDGGPSASGNITLTINSINKIISVTPAGFIKIQ